VDTGAVDPVIWGCRLYGLSENQTDLEVHYPFKCLFRRPVGLPAVGGRGRQVKGQLMRFELDFPSCLKVDGNCDAVIGTILVENFYIR